MDEVLECARYKIELDPNAQNQTPLKKLAHHLEDLASVLRDDEVKRIRITLSSFPEAIDAMKEYFDPKQPTAALRAFYRLLPQWHAPNIFSPDDQDPRKGSLAGRTIENILPSKRLKLKEFVDARETVRVRRGYDNAHLTTRRWPLRAVLSAAECNLGTFWSA